MREVEDGVPESPARRIPYLPHELEVAEYDVQYPRQLRALQLRGRSRDATALQVENQSLLVSFKVQKTTNELALLPNIKIWGNQFKHVLCLAQSYGHMP